MSFAPPHALVVDQRGKHCQLRIDNNDYSVRFTLSRHKTPAGMAQCVINSPQTLTLADITIFDNVSWHEPAFLRALRVLFRRPLRIISYRGKGLGSALLEHVKDYARLHGFKRITGLARSDDIPAQALFGWYRRHGFEVDEAGHMQFVLDN